MNPRPRTTEELMGHAAELVISGPRAIPADPILHGQIADLQKYAAEQLHRVTDPGMLLFVADQIVGVALQLCAIEALPEVPSKAEQAEMNGGQLDEAARRTAAAILAAGLDVTPQQFAAAYEYSVAKAVELLDEARAAQQ